VFLGKSLRRKTFELWILLESRKSFGDATNEREFRNQERQIWTANRELKETFELVWSAYLTGERIKPTISDMHVLEQRSSVQSKLRVSSTQARNTLKSKNIRMKTGLLEKLERRNLVAKKLENNRIQKEEQRWYFYQERISETENGQEKTERGIPNLLIM